MKLNQKLAIAFLAVGTGVFGLSSGAFAIGAGGAAGGAAFTIDTTTSKVTGVAVSAAVGKNDAAASAFNVSGGNSAYSLGSAGVITTTGMTAIGSATNTMAGSADADVTKAQINVLTNPASIQLGTAASNAVVTTP